MSAENNPKSKGCPDPNLGIGILMALMTKVGIGDNGAPVKTPMLDPTSLHQVAQMAVQNPRSIQLGGYVDYVGLSPEEIQEIKKAQLEQIPEVRKPYLEKLAQVIKTTPTIPIDISLRSINPFTPFENQPPILFGMGGGSQKLCQGLPFDVLSMVLTAEKIRKELRWREN